MGLIIQKFGGTSVANLECLTRVADIIVKAREAGHSVVVVSSAQQGETDRLLNLARAIQDPPDPREYSALLCTGEQVATALLSLCLLKRGYQARSYTGWQVGIRTDSVLHKARIMDIDPTRIQRDLALGRIPVIAGFQGVDTHDTITTLGRGGSDTTAVALGAILKADECQIYTDVDGIYTADPRIVPSARRLEKITFPEMLELASLGAKVLQPRSVEFAGKYKVPLRVLSTFQPDDGTLIALEENPVEEAVISGIALNRHQAKLTLQGLPDQPGVASKILGRISAAQVDIDMIVQSTSSDCRSALTFTVGRDDYRKAQAILDELAQEWMGEVFGKPAVAKLSLVGVGVASHGWVASKMFETLGNEGINIQLITTSEIKVSVIVDEEHAERGVRALHEAFELGGKSDT